MFCCVKLDFMEKGKFSRGFKESAGIAKTLLEEKIKDTSSREAETNFTYIKGDISPILFDLCHFGEKSDGGSGTNLRIEFGVRPVFNLQSQSKFILYDGNRLYLCLSTGDGGEDFERLTEIRGEEDLRTICKRQGKEARKAVLSFSRMSKKDILLKTIYSVKSLFLSDPAMSDSNHEPKPKPNLSSVMEAFFTRHKKN